MHAFAKKFIKTLIVQFKHAVDMKSQNEGGNKIANRSEWVARAKQLRLKIDMQEKKAGAF